RRRWPLSRSTSLRRLRGRAGSLTTSYSMPCSSRAFCTLKQWSMSLCRNVNGQRCNLRDIWLLLWTGSEAYPVGGGSCERDGSSWWASGRRRPGQAKPRQLCRESGGFEGLAAGGVAGLRSDDQPVANGQDGAIGASDLDAA